MKQNHDCSNWNESWWAIKWVICCLALCCFDCRKTVFCVEDQFGLSISQAVCTKAMWAWYLIETKRAKMMGNNHFS